MTSTADAGGKNWELALKDEIKEDVSTCSVEYEKLHRVVLGVAFCLPTWQEAQFPRITPTNQFWSIDFHTSVVQILVIVLKK